MTTEAENKDCFDTMASIHTGTWENGVSNAAAFSALGKRNEQTEEGGASEAVPTDAFFFPKILSNAKPMRKSPGERRFEVSGADVAGVALSISDRRNSNSRANGHVLLDLKTETERQTSARKTRRLVVTVLAVVAAACVVAFAANSFLGAYEAKQNHKAALAQDFEELSSADEREEAIPYAIVSDAFIRDYLGI